MNRQRTSHGDERGYVLVFTALTLVVLMLFAAFAVDVGVFYSRANQIQRAADAASTAGVVYLPNLNRARQEALAEAERNGFVDGQDGVSVTVDRGDTPRRLRVSIIDPAVETVFGQVVYDSISMTRRATAEFVGSIPLGSPYNALGTGNLDATNGGIDYLNPSDGQRQNFWLAVNGFCAAKEDGDRRLSAFDGTRVFPTTFPVAAEIYQCGTSPVPTGTNPRGNTDFQVDGGGVPLGYEYIVDVPCVGRTELSIPCLSTASLGGNPVTVDIYNPVFDAGNDFRTSSPGPDTLLRYPVATPVPAGLNATDTADFAAFPSATVAQYLTNAVVPTSRTRVTTHFEVSRQNDSDPNRWDVVAMTPLTSTTGDGQVVASSAALQFGTCDSVNPALDWTRSNAVLASLVPAQPALAWAPSCTSSLLGWVPSFELPTPGRWRIRVYTEPNQNHSQGVNGFALRARRSGSTFSLCDTRATGGPASCPSVAGNSTMSIQAVATIGNGDTADLFLSRLAPADEFRGKQVAVYLWDLGEGMDRLQILEPGTNTAVSFRWRYVDPNVDGCTESSSDKSFSGREGVAFIDLSQAVRGSPAHPCGAGRVSGFTRFSGRLVEVILDLPPTYGSAPGFDGWWKVRYRGGPDSAGGLRDRTTWAVQLQGDPVHLIRD